VRPSHQIVDEVASWPGVSVHPHRFGGREMRLGRRELGHLHGDTLADLPFTVRERDDLLSQGRAQRHHWLPDSGWVTHPLDGPDDVEAVLDLFRRSYQRAVRAESRRARTRSRSSAR
jgi:hypothetical protein